MLKEWLNEGGGLYMAAGGVTSFIMALLRAKHTKMIDRLGEATTCSLLSTGLITLANIYYPQYPQLGIFIGVFVGFLGSDYLTSLIKNTINYLLDKLIKGNSSK